MEYVIEVSEDKLELIKMAAAAGIGDWVYRIVAKGKPLDQEPTTKNEAKYCDRNICLKNEYNGIGCEDCEVTKSQEPTTKNDLGVDCVSRKEVINTIRDWWKTAIMADGEPTLCDSIRDLPSVTPQEPRWIPVSERMPDTDDEVLCWYEYYHWSQEKVLPEYGIGRYFEETSSWFGEVANGHKVRVIAWMPLPKPYEPQESEG